MALRKLHTSDERSLPWTRFFFAGNSGSGKTTIVGTFPNVLIIEPGMEASSTTLAETGVEAEVWRIDSKEDLDQAFDELLLAHDKFLKTGDDKHFPWESVALESITHYSDLLVAWLTKGYREDMNQRKWGDLSQLLINYHNKLASLQAHVIYTSLVDVKGGKEGEPVRVVPMIQGGRARDIIPSACNAVGFCEYSTRLVQGKRIDDYRVHFKPYRNFPARTRYKWLPATMVNFNFTELYSSAFNK